MRPAVHLAEDSEMAAWTPYVDAIKWRRRFLASVAINVLLVAALLYYSSTR